VGAFEVELRLHRDVRAKVTVNVQVEAAVPPAPRREGLTFEQPARLPGPRSRRRGAQRLRSPAFWL
jgi:hypothetical protein